MNVRDWGQGRRAVLAMTIAVWLGASACGEPTKQSDAAQSASEDPKGDGISLGCENVMLINDLIADSLNDASSPDEAMSAFFESDKALTSLPERGWSERGSESNATLKDLIYEKEDERVGELSIEDLGESWYVTSAAFCTSWVKERQAGSK